MTSMSRSGAVTLDVPVRRRLMVLLPLVIGCTACGSDAEPVSPDTRLSATEGHALVAPPFIDGAPHPEEWKGAGSVHLGSGNATFYYGTHGDILYLALAVTDDGAHWDDGRWEIRFDNERDGARDAGEDHLVLSATDGFQDRHASSSSWGVPDLHADGVGATSGLMSLIFFEVAHPLNSGDPTDLSLAPGDRLGYCFSYSNQESGHPGVTFPASCIAEETDLGSYAELWVESVQ